MHEFTDYDYCIFQGCIQYNTCWSSIPTLYNISYWNDGIEVALSPLSHSLTLLTHSLTQSRFTMMTLRNNLYARLK